MNKIIILCFSSLLVSGCDTRNLAELSYAEQQEMLVQFSATCAELGITKNHPEYRTCVQAEINAENARRGRQSAALSGAGQGFSNMGDSYTAAAQRRPVTCTTTPAVGWGSATTRCY